MKINIVYKNLEQTSSIEEKIREKAEQFRKFFKSNLEVKWICNVSKHVHESEVIVHAGHSYFCAKAEDKDLYKTFDQVVHKINRQLERKYGQLKDKIHHHHEETIESLN